MVIRYADPPGSWSLEASDYGVIGIFIIAVFVIIGVLHQLGIF